MSLIEKLNALIAKQLGVRPEEITRAFIEQRRVNRKFRIVEDDTNQYGGRHVDGLRRLTDDEVKAARESFDELTAGARH